MNPTRSAEETPCCRDRAAIVGLLAQHHENERRFALGEMIEQGDRVAVEFSVANPAWSGAVTLFKVFTFRPGENVVVRLNDCLNDCTTARLHRRVVRTPGSHCLTRGLQEARS